MTTLLLSRLLVRTLELCEKRVDRVIHRFLAHALVPDDTILVEDVNGRPTAHIPSGGDRTVRPWPVEEVAPGDVLLGRDFLELLRRLIAVHTDEREWLVLQTLHERPLVREHSPARGSP